MENINVSITPSEVMEYLYCPRFIYFMLYLKIPQNEEQRYKVQQGRLIHQQKMVNNKNYLRKSLNVKEKLINQKLVSEKYQIHGIVDEILFFEDGTAAPVDYKFAEYKGRIFQTYKYQIIMYAIMIEENFKIPVNRGYIIYTRSKNKLVEVKIDSKDRYDVLKITNSIIKILDKGYFPHGTEYQKRCFDCCYRNICIK